MYTAITAETSLFFIEDDTLAFQFKEIAQKMSMFNNILHAGGVNKEDAWIIAFNIWLMLQPDEYNIIESAEKTIYYSSNFIIFNAMKNDYHIKYIRTSTKKTPEFLYLTALNIAEGLNKWIADVMIRENISSILERNRTRSYFKAHMGTDEEVKQFIKDQALFVKAIIPIIANTKEIERLIKKCCDEATFLYEKNYFNQLHK
ncbi:hypothetical protein [Solibacillus sp. CAU 1738]|uniref:hypothetical protein n=1 Tax=Solibacillus sp. CAU 1738 TaxID=3140363 RepID=UPI003261CAE2